MNTDVTLLVNHRSLCRMRSKSRFRRNLSGLLSVGSWALSGVLRLPPCTSTWTTSERRSCRSGTGRVGTKADRMSCSVYTAKWLRWLALSSVVS